MTTTSLQGRDVAGIRVYPPDRLGELITQPRRPGGDPLDALRRRRRGARRSSPSSASYPVKIRALPAITDLASGKYLVSQLREIDIDDLLGRSSVPADPELLRRRCSRAGSSSSPAPAARSAPS